MDACAFPGGYRALAAQCETIGKRLPPSFCRPEVGFGVVGNVDAILCYLQGFIKKISSVRFRALPVRLGVGRRSRSQFGCVGGEQAEGVGIAVAKLIEFYVPIGFRAPERPAHAPRGVVIEFRSRNAEPSGRIGKESRRESAPIDRPAVVDVQGRWR